MIDESRERETLEGAHDDPEKLVEKVREKYGEIAKASSSGCCGSSAQQSCCSTSGSIGYSSDDIATIPDGADLGLGCGAPIQHLELQPGETALDLGSGAGIDVFLAAARVGETGRAIGVDMTPEMIEKARNNANKTGLRQVEFRLGRLEALPVDDDSVDAVTSNCVINLVPDKTNVFREISRVLKEGGRVVVSDIVLDGDLPDAVREDVASYVGCVSGALQRADYFAAVEAAGLSKVEILDDIDAIATRMDITPDKMTALSDRTGVPLENLMGKVRSVTFRAFKF
jgi:SAM-dependent methyltransferase